jgi:hypothetical protein
MNAKMEVGMTNAISVINFFVEKTLANNVKHILKHNNNKSHLRFVELQDIASQVVLYWYDFHILNILSILLQIRLSIFVLLFIFLVVHKFYLCIVLISKWNDHGHFMVCKLCSTFVPTCYDSIMKHVGGSQHLDKLQIESAIPFTCKYYVSIIFYTQNY